MDFGAILASPRVFCGSSDITMLLNALEKAGMVVFHGPMVATTLGLGPGAYDRTIFEKLLIRGEAVRFPTGGCRGLVAGEAEGPLTGGCLSLVVSLLGTRWEIDTRDRLLVLEDTHCRPYQIDRMLTQMLQAGKLDGVRGFIFGEMQDCYQNDTEGYTLEDVVVDVLGGLGVPILYDFPTGHSTRPNVVVPFGVPARIRVGSTRADPAGEAPIVFELLEPAVGPR
jgi:muramoyltetrapeptide carboxypeptidase